MLSADLFTDRLLDYASATRFDREMAMASQAYFWTREGRAAGRVKSFDGVEALLEELNG